MGSARPWRRAAKLPAKTDSPPRKWEALDNAAARLVAAAEGPDSAAGDQEILITIKAAIAGEQGEAPQGELGSGSPQRD
ncbi:MAG: hypothetical protein ICV67_00350 [Thermoleophilia bacterium]|nr:hypothetical protein [Thermoleophilia bacterium]